jgi:hypothetical protein
MQQGQIAPSTRPAAKISALTAQRNNAPIAARNYSTEELACGLKVGQQTARAAYCRDGHYLGVVPIKLRQSGGLLLWDEAEADALLAGRTVKADPEKIDEHFARKAADASKRSPHIRVRKAEAKAKRLAAVTAGEVA